MWVGRVWRKLTGLDVLDFWRSDDGGCGGEAEAERCEVDDELHLNLVWKRKDS